MFIRVVSYGQIRYVLSPYWRAANQRSREPLPSTLETACDNRDDSGSARVLVFNVEGGECVASRLKKSDDLQPHSMIQTSLVLVLFVHQIINHQNV